MESSEHWVSHSECKVDLGWRDVVTFTLSVSLPHVCDVLKQDLRFSVIQREKSGRVWLVFKK